MSFKHTIEAMELLDDPRITGEAVGEAIRSAGTPDVVVSVQTVRSPRGRTDFLKVVVPGSSGKSRGGNAPTLGIIGQLGGVGARPVQIGLVSDADGAIAVVAASLKLSSMLKKGDVLAGDVILTTHICPSSPVIPHDPVPFMGSPVDMEEMNRHMVDAAMDAVLSIDTTRGNRIINHKGFAISPTVKEGWILRVSEDLLDIMAITTGRPPVTFPITMQDITPYGNDVYHLNSIMQPATATSSPVVGVAVTSETVVPGCATGANHAADIDDVVRFVIEVAKSFGSGKCRFYDPVEFDRLVALYGRMDRLQRQDGRLARDRLDT